MSWDVSQHYTNSDNQEIVFDQEQAKRVGDLDVQELKTRQAGLLEQLTSKLLWN